MNVEDLISPHLRQMKPYTPIVPFEVLSQRLGIPRDQLVKLDANENPYGPSPLALQALASADTLHIYPDPDQTALRAAIASYIGVGAEHILCGAGVDEVIDLVGRAFVQPGDAVIDLPPTFGMYRFEADITNARYVSIPRKSDFSLDIDAIRSGVLNTPQAKLLFVANPNNPDGSLISDAELQQLLALPLIVILDEAYIDFSSQTSRVTWAQQFDNLIVLRTFSKLAGLAGLRVGYGVFPLRIIKHLWKVKQPYTPNVAGSIAAISALEDRDYLQRTVGLLIAERKCMTRALGGFTWLSPYPSAANFVLCKVNESALSELNALVCTALELKRWLEQRGILVRHFDKDGLRDCIRVSAGRPSDTDKLIEALRMLTAENAP
jgi:histidinol-phosphate aminotransferase